MPPPALAALTLLTAAHFALVLRHLRREPWLLMPLVQCAAAIRCAGEPLVALPAPLPHVLVCVGLSLPVIGGTVNAIIVIFDTRLGWLARFHHTHVGGVLSHGLNIPLWTLMFNGPFGASALLVCGGWYAALGAALWLLMSTLNWGVTLPYCPRWSESLYNLDMGKVVSRCELRGELDRIATSRTLFLFHPHGVVSEGFTCNGCYSREFNRRAGELPPPADGAPGPAARTTGPVFLIDRLLRELTSFFKLVCDMSGRLESATKQNVRRHMAAGRNICIIPGGLQEAALFQYGRERVYLRRRKGIVKYALQHGYALTPVYTFGESRTYYAFPGMLWLRLRITDLGLPACLLFGNPKMPLYPRYDAALLTYVGAPLQLPTLPEPTQTDVDRWHQAYMDALQELFDGNKSDAGVPDAQLEIW